MSICNSVLFDEVDWVQGSVRYEEFFCVLWTKRVIYFACGKFYKAQYV
jgi:hypothetical protein